MWGWSKIGIMVKASAKSLTEFVEGVSPAIWGLALVSDDWIKGG